jgi:DNA-nicking Smr family endonuclease
MCDQPQPPDHNLTAEDREFLAAMAAGGPLPGADEALLEAVSADQEAAEAAELEAHLAAHPPPSDPSPQAVEEGAPPVGSRGDPGRRLRRRVADPGWLPQAQLDLHGQRLPTALQTLERFFRWGQAEGLENFLVITGQGRHSAAAEPILGPAVRRWLAERGVPYLPTPSRLGGSGAIIVLLPQPEGRC